MPNGFAVFATVFVEVEPTVNHDVQAAFSYVAMDGSLEPSGQLRFQKFFHKCSIFLSVSLRTNLGGNSYALPLQRMFDFTFFGLGLSITVTLPVALFVLKIKSPTRPDIDFIPGINSTFAIIL